MTRHFHESLEQLRQKVIRMGHLVESSIDRAVLSLVEKNRLFIEEVFEKEGLINEIEVEIDQLGHGLFALGQPVAVDLRLLTAMLKMSTDLERLGDHAVNIAERALKLLDCPVSFLELNLTDLSKASQAMLHHALDSFSSGDSAKAHHVLESDDEVDRQHESLITRLESRMQADSAFVATGIQLARIGHDLERIADLASNIAEDVIYILEGREVRHRLHL